MASVTDNQEFVRVEHLEDVLVASLRLCGVRFQADAAVEVGLVERAFEAYRTLLGQANGVTFSYLPLSLVVDVYGLCVMGDRTPFSSDARSARQDLDEEAKGRRRDYENRVLSRLLSEPSFREARARMQLSPRDHHRGVVRLVEFVLERFSPLLPSGPRMHPARLRTLEMPAAGRLDPKAACERLGGDGLDERMAEFVERVVERVAWTGLLEEADLFELEHWQALSDASLRTGCRQLVELSSKFADLPMPHVRPSQEFAEVQTEMADDSIYPKGGFSGLTNRGSFENLVRSELVYMESDTTKTDTGKAASEGVSVFDLRFVQNELLYYLRNDGSLRRRRRDVHVVFDIADNFPVRLAGWPARYATVVQAVAIRVVRDLLAVYEEDAVSARLTYLAGDDGPLAAASEEERALVEVVLQEEIAKEFVELAGPQPSASVEAPERVTHMVVFASGRDAASSWCERLGSWRETGLPVLGVLVATDTGDWQPEVDEPAVLNLPASTVSVRELAELAHRLYARLIGAKWRP